MPDGMNFVIADLVPAEEDAQVITPLMLQVEQIVIRHANAAAPMPANPVLGELAGGRKRQSAARALDRLEAVGRILIERSGLLRRVFVVSLGVHTGWGATRPSHAPYSTNPKGAEKIDTRVRRPLSRPLAAGALSGSLPPPVKDSDRSPAPGPSCVCQWPLWADGERPNGRFCSAVSEEGSSFCFEHHELAYPTRSKRRDVRDSAKIRLRPPHLGTEARRIMVDLVRPAPSPTKIVETKLQAVLDPVQG